MKLLFLTGNDKDENIEEKSKVSGLVAALPPGFDFYGKRGFPIRFEE